MVLPHVITVRESPENFLVQSNGNGWIFYSCYFKSLFSEIIFFIRSENVQLNYKNIY